MLRIFSICEERSPTREKLLIRLQSPQRYQFSQYTPTLVPHLPVQRPVSRTTALVLNLLRYEQNRTLHFLRFLGLNKWYQKSC